MNPWTNGGSYGADNNTEVVGTVHFRRILTSVELVQDVRMMDPVWLDVRINVEDDVTVPSPGHF